MIIKDLGESKMVENLEHKKENMFWFYFLSFTWGLPFTLIGLFVLAFIRIFLNKRIKEYRVVAGRIAIISNDDLPGAMELGIAYLMDKTTAEDYYTHTHEIGHSIQNTWFGPFFIFIVAIPSFIRATFWGRYVKWLYKKKGKYADYDGIWFEGQATKLGHIYCGERVKKAITTNQSNTI